MKKAGKFLATAFAAVMCMIPLTACDEAPAATGDLPEVTGKAFSIADYAAEPPASKTVEGKYQTLATLSSVAEKDFTLQSISSGIGFAKQAGSGDNYGKYCLYDLANNRSLSDVWYDSIEALSGSPFIRLEKDGKYQLASPMGTLVTTQLFESTSNVYTSRSNFYQGDKSYDVYALTYKDTTAQKDVTVYVSNKDGKWAESSRKEYYGNSQGGFEVGDELGTIKYPIADPSLYPEYIYRDYSYTVEGSSTRSITFYHNDSKVGSVTVRSNSGAVWYVGKYFYYYVTEPVSSDATAGYNTEETSGYGYVVKANKTLHRYNFVEGKDETVESNYIFTVSNSSSSTLLYNKSTNDVDKVLVNAYRKTNGVAVISSYSPSNTAILDDEANISLDLTGKSFSDTLYALSSERFLTGDTIYDKDMNVIAQLPTSYSSSYPTLVWKAQNLILAYNSNSSNSNYFAVDHNGKVVMTGLTNSLVIYGDKLLSADSSNGFVYSKDWSTGKPLTEIVTAGEGETVTPCGAALCKTTESGVEFFDLGGKSIGKVDEASVSTYPSPIAFGGKYYISARKGTQSITIVIS